MRRPTFIFIFSLIASASSTAFAVLGRDMPLSRAASTVELISSRDGRHGAICSATKIGQKTFLTSARCLVVVQDLQFIRRDSRRSVEIDVYEAPTVVRVLAHPLYAAEAQSRQFQVADHDLAIFEIAEDTPEVSTAVLPKKKMKIEGAPVFVAGYGAQTVDLGEPFGFNSFLKIAMGYFTSGDQLDAKDDKFVATITRTDSDDDYMLFGPEMADGRLGAGDGGSGVYLIDGNLMTQVLVGVVGAVDPVQLGEAVDITEPTISKWIRSNIDQSLRRGFKPMTISPIATQAPPSTPTTTPVPTKTPAPVSVPVPTGSPVPVSAPVAASIKTKPVVPPQTVSPKPAPPISTSPKVVRLPTIPEPTQQSAPVKSTQPTPVKPAQVASSQSTAPPAPEQVKAPTPVAQPTKSVQPQATVQSPFDDTVGAGSDD